MLRKIDLKNYKAFEKLKAEFRPITVILGPNNSGKTALMSAPRLLAQTVNSFDQFVPLLLNGKMGDFGTYKDLVYTNNSRRHIELGFEIDCQTHNIYLPKHIIQKMPNRVFFKAIFSYRSNRREIVLESVEISGDSRKLMKVSRQQESGRFLVDSIRSKQVPPALKAGLSKNLRVYNFLPRSLFVSRLDRKSQLGRFLTTEDLDVVRIIHNLSDYASFFFRDVEYIGPLRRSPERFFLYSGEHNQKVGIAGENATNILMMDSARRGKASKGIRKKIVSWMNQAGLAGDLAVDPASDRHFELKIQNFASGEYENYADVGFGHSQVIPILVAGFNLIPGSTFVVEQPEIHLHPRAQGALGNFFHSIYLDGNQSVIETHSEHLVVSLQQLVAAGAINPEDILFYYVYSDGKKRVVKGMDIDTNGQFKDPWPQGFFPERLEQAKELSRIRRNSSELRN